MPGSKGPVLSAVAESSPSNTSLAAASPNATAVTNPVELAVTSAGAVTTGSTSSAFGSLPSRYSSRLLRPSPSASAAASSASLGSSEFSTSNKSSMPSPSVSFSPLAATTVTVELFWPCRASASTAENVTTVSSPTANESGASFVTSSSLPEKSVAVAALINAAMSGCDAGTASPSTETIVMGSATLTLGPTATSTITSLSVAFPAASVALKVTVVSPTGNSAGNSL